LKIPRVNPDNEYRYMLEKLAEENGRDFLYNMLREKDPAMCKKLHKDGFRVVGNYHTKEKAEKWMEQMKEEGFNIELFYGDVSDFASAANMIKEIEEKIGTVDTLVNNAGINHEQLMGNNNSSSVAKVTTPLTSSTKSLVASESNLISGNSLLISLEVIVLIVLMYFGISKVG